MSFKNNKRSRAANFSTAEEKLLLQCVLKRKDIIEDKRTDAHTTDEKNAAWNEITQEFNASSANLEPRKVKALRDKYTNFKGNLRKKFASKRIDRLTTGDSQSDAEWHPPNEELTELSEVTHSDLKTKLLEQEIELNELKKEHLRKGIGLLDGAKQMQDELMAMSRAEHQLRMRNLQNFNC